MCIVYVGGLQYSEPPKALDLAPYRIHAHSKPYNEKSFGSKVLHAQGSESRV